MQKPLKKQISEKSQDLAKRVINHVNSLIRDRLVHFCYTIKQKGENVLFTEKVTKPFSNK